MTIEKIPADKIMIMSDEWHRAFNTYGCDPMCHCCDKLIKVNGKFHLATIQKTKSPHWGDGLEMGKRALQGEKITGKTILKEESDYFYIRDEFKDNDKQKLKERVNEFTLESHEVMLCDKCTAETYFNKQINEIDQEIVERDEPKGGCFRINGKIIH